MSKCKGEAVPCVLCNTTYNDECDFGFLKRSRNITVHYYCLLLSEKITQSGTDKQGILGFMDSDINKEKLRAATQICYYCNKKGASLGCSYRKCNRKFHLPCSMKKYVQHNFEKFNSLCHSHRKPSNLPIHIKNDINNYMCLICMENFTKSTHVYNIIWAECCKSNTLLHIKCAKKMAMSAGYFNKCPNCSDIVIFNKFLKEFGVFVPERDASWELVSNYFSALYQTHNTCDVETCLSTRGRKYKDSKKWKLLLCNTCGSYGAHTLCSNFTSEFTCPNCCIDKSTAEEYMDHTATNDLKAKFETPKLDQPLYETTLFTQCSKSENSSFMHSIDICYNYDKKELNDANDVVQLCEDSYTSKYLFGMEGELEITNCKIDLNGEPIEYSKNAFSTLSYYQVITDKDLEAKYSSKKWNLTGSTKKNRTLLHSVSGSSSGHICKDLRKRSKIVKFNFPSRYRLDNISSSF